MKISAESGAFAKALSIVTRASSLKATVLALSAVLIEARGNVLTMKATDNEMSITLKSSARVEEEGMAAVPARMLNEIVSRLAEGKITFSSDEKQATLTTDSSSYTLRSYDPSEFPQLPQFDQEAAFSVPAKDLSGAIRHASAAVSSDDSRPVLCGLLASFSGGELTMASTDSYRLALHRASVGGGPEQDTSAIIPARALTEVGRLAEMDQSIEVMLTENQALFKIKSVVVTTRLIDGNFPEYSRLLPESFDKSFEVDAQQLRESLRRANLFSGASSKTAKKGGPPGAPVRFTFSSEEGTLAGGKLTISSKSEDTGEATESLDAKLPEDTGEFVTAFNGRYIAEGVAQVISAGAQTVRIRANEPLKPVVLDYAPGKEAEEGPKYLYLIMPMRDPNGEDATNA